MHRVGVASRALCLRPAGPAPAFTLQVLSRARLPLCGGVSSARLLSRSAAPPPLLSSGLALPRGRPQSSLLRRAPATRHAGPLRWRAHLPTLSCSYATAPPPTPLDEGRPLPRSAEAPVDTSAVPSDGGGAGPGSMAEAAREMASQTNVEAGAISASGLFDAVNPVGLVTELLGMVHGAGLPWWVAIVAATAVLRTCMLPLVVQSMKNAANMRKIKPEMDALKRWYSEQGGRSNPAATTEFQTELGAVMKSNNVSMLKGFMVPLVQAPVFISFFFALRRLAVEDPSLATGGFYPFMDLSTADPMMVAPALTALTMWATIELGSETGGQQQQAQVIKWVFRGLAIAMFPLTMGLPKCVHLYWFCSNVFSLGQLGMFKAFPGLKPALGIPIVDEPAKGASATPIVQPSFSSRPASKTASRNVVDSEVVTRPATAKKGKKRGGRRRRA